MPATETGLNAVAVGRIGHAFAPAASITVAVRLRAGWLVVAA